MDEYSFIRGYLTDNEYVLWKGKPEKGNLISGRDLILLPFSIFWLGFSLFWELMVIKTTNSVFMIIWGLPFIAIGIYLLVGRFIFSCLQKNKTYYVITNKRIIIKKGNKLQLFDSKDIPAMNITIHRSGNATIIFADNVYGQRNYYGRTYFTFDNIKDYIQVQSAINRMDK